MLQSTIGDIGVGICYAHDTPQHYTTVIISGSIDVESEGRDNAIVTSIGCATCGHPTIALTGSGSVNHNSLGSHRVGDMGQNGGPYHMITGRPSVDVGD
jgi:hypothetical protein